MARIQAPDGDFNWMGFDWIRRDGGLGSPGKAGWARDNVVIPDSPDGPLTLRLEPGRPAMGAEVRTTRRGFGYGTYTCVIEKDDFPAMHRSIVFGGMFTYDGNSPPGYQELDMCETSAWDSRWSPVLTSHILWFDADAGGRYSSSYVETFDHVRTHRCVWAPDSVTYESWSGVGFGGRLLKRTVYTDQIPKPREEVVVFNLWVFGDSHPTQPETVTIRHFSMVPGWIIGSSRSFTSELPANHYSPWREDVFYQSFTDDGPGPQRARIWMP